MNKYIEAIKRVIEKRIGRGATIESIMRLKEQLKVTWKNSPAMIEAIDNIKIEGVKTV